MAARVTAILPTRDDAERTADELVDMGADRSQISIVSRGGEKALDTTPDSMAHDDDHAHSHVMEPAALVGDSGAPLTTTDEADAARGAGAGAVLGAIVGIATGAAMLAVPGFGWVLAAGPLAWAIGGAVGATIGGALVGGIYGALRDLGIPENHARAYEERIHGGGVLMTALVPSLDEARVRDILAEYDAEDVTFVDDTSLPNWSFPAGEAAMATSASAPAYPADQMAAPTAQGVRDSTYMAPPTAPRAVIESTTVAMYETTIAPGEAKPAPAERQGSEADRSPSPVVDFTAKGEKAAGTAQEELDEEEEAVDQRA